MQQLKEELIQENNWRKNLRAHQAEGKLSDAGGKSSMIGGGVVANTQIHKLMKIELSEGLWE